MDQEPDVIRHDIEQTRESLTEKLEVLESEVKGTIADAKETVTGTIETAKQTVEDITSNVKETVQETVQSVKRTFDLPYQTQLHPWGMMCGSMVAGFLAGYLLPSTRRIAQWGHRLAARAAAPSAAPRYEAPSRPNGQAQQPAATSEGPGMLDRLLEQFEPEVNKVKEMAIGTVVGLLRDWITHNIPASLAPKVEELLNQTTSKLGGEPIRGPVLEERTPAGSATR